LIREIGPYVRDYIRMMDGNGTYRHFLYPGTLADQPFLVMDILDIVRARWNELRNKEQEDGLKGKYSH